MCSDESYLATGASGSHGRIRAATTAIQFEFGGLDTFSQGRDGVAGENQIGIVTANHDNIKRRKRIRAGHVTIWRDSPTPICSLSFIRFIPDL